MALLSSRRIKNITMGLVVIPVALILLLVSSVTAQSTVVPPSPSGPTDPLRFYRLIGEECKGDTDCLPPVLTCMASGDKKHCDCKTPDDTTDCSCNQGMLKYRRWVKEGNVCLLTYGQTCGKDDKCAGGLKCEGFCKTAGASVIFPGFLTLISLCSINIYIIWSGTSS